MGYNYRGSNSTILQPFSVGAYPYGKNLLLIYRRLFEKAVTAAPVQITVGLQWLEHLWNHENMFKTGVVQATES